MSSYRLPVSIWAFFFFHLFPTINTPLYGAVSAIELPVENILLLKNLAKRAYEDSDHARGDRAEVHEVLETIGGINWRKKPFVDGSMDRISPVGAVYYSQMTQATVVAFHGSYWTQDWSDDFKFWTQPAAVMSDALMGRVHAGFSSRVAGSYDDMVEKLQELLGRGVRSSDQIYFTGHSLGGALASLAATTLSVEINSNANCIKVVTFSSPRRVLGCSTFVEQAHRKLGLENILCFSTKGDIVPSAVPPGTDYQPFGSNI